MSAKAPKSTLKIKIGMNTMRKQEKQKIAIKKRDEQAQFDCTQRMGKRLSFQHVINDASTTDYTHLKFTKNLAQTSDIQMNFQFRFLVIIFIFKHKQIDVHSYSSISHDSCLDRLFFFFYLQIRCFDLKIT